MELGNDLYGGASYARVALKGVVVGGHIVKKV